MVSHSIYHQYYNMTSSAETGDNDTMYIPQGLLPYFHNYLQGTMNIKMTTICTRVINDNPFQHKIGQGLKKMIVMYIKAPQVTPENFPTNPLHPRSFFKEDI